MKRLLLTMIVGVSLSAAGCHIGECWRYAWNSRFHPERNAQLCQPQYMMVDPCSDPCSDGAIVTTPTTGGGCGCGTPTVTPGPMVTR